MRLPLATDLKTRPSAPDKDARLTNAYVEVKNGQEVVRKRPAASGGVSVGTGTAQGGIGLNIGGTDYIYTVNGDTGAMDTLATAGTTWDSGTSYSIGDHVSYGFVDYWALTDNTNSDPTSNPSDWSTSYVPYVPFAGTYAHLALGTENLQMNYSNISKNTGKWYWEMTITEHDLDSDIHEVGIKGSLLGTTGVGWSWNPYPSGGVLALLNGEGGVPSPQPAIPIVGDTLGFAFDAGGGSIAVRFPDGNTVTVTYGSAYLMKAQFEVMLDANGTVNFGASPFVYEVPSGYNSGLYTL